MNKKAALVGGIGLGAALMYLFDPERGKRRRSVIRDKVESAANKTGDYAGKMSRDLRNRAYGLVAETKSIFQNEELTDEVLIDRVRSKLGRYSVDVGAIDMTAQSGTLILGGSVLAKEVPDVLSAVRSVRGVKRVENQLRMLPEDDSVPSSQGSPELLGSQTATAGGI